MRHTDPDRLTLIALGEVQRSPEDVRHLDSCATCAEQVDSLREVVELGRETRDERDLPRPSPGVWARIAAETGQADVAPSTPAPPRAPGRTHGLRLVAVAAAAAVLGAGAAVAVGSIATRDQRPGAVEQVIARTDLDRLPSAPPDARGEAQIVRTADSVRLRLRVDGMPAPEGLYQVWLYDGNDTMIPLAVLTGGEVEVIVPDSIDVDDYPVVDVSAQDLGQQEHGVSMLQGEFD